MKKIKDVIIIFLIFILIYFLQINIFNTFTIFNVKPNLFIILIFSIGIKYNRLFSSIMGIVIGFCLDLLISSKIGINMFLFGGLGFITSYLSELLFSENKLTNILIIFFSTVIIEIIKYLLNIVFLNINIEINLFVFITLIESIYNVLLFIIIYPLWKILLGKNKMNDNKLIRYL